MPSRTLQVEIVGNAAQLERALGKAAASTQGFGAKLESAGKRATAVGKTLTRDLTLPLVGVAAVSIKMAGDFQRSMEMIHTQAGVSQKSVDQMSKSILGMAKSVGTGPETLSEGMFHLASQGLRGAKAMDALKVAAEGAKVGQANLEDVTNALGAVLVSGIKGADNMTQAMGALNAVVGAGDMHMQDLADALGTGLPAKAAVFGVSLRDAGAALAVFGDNNIRGAEAGTLFNSTLRVMGAETKAAAKVLKTIGIGQTELANDLRSPAGLVGALTDLKTHMEKAGLSASQQAALLTRAFGGRQAGGVLILIDQLARLKTKETEVAAGATGFGAAWQSTTQTAAFKFDQLKASLEATGISLGTKLLLVALRLGQALEGLIGVFQNLDPVTQRFLIYGAGIAAALGPAIGIVGRFAVAIRGVGSALAFATGSGGGALLGGALLGVGAAAAVGITAAFKLAQKWRDAGTAFDTARDAILRLRGSLDELRGKQDSLSQANVNLMRDQALLTQSTQAWHKVIKEGKTHTTEGILAYTAYRQSLAMVRSDSNAVAAAHRSVTAEEAKRANSTKVLTGKVEEMGSKLNKILTLKDPLGYMMTHNILDPQSWTSLGSAIAHPISAFEGFLAGTSKTENIQKASTQFFRLADAAEATAKGLASSDPKMARTAARVATVSVAVGELINKYGRVPSKKQIAAEIKLMKDQGWDQHLAQILGSAKKTGDQSGKGLVAGVQKAVGQVGQKAAQAARAVGSAGGVAFSTGEGVGAQAGAGIAAGLQAQIAGIAAAAASTVRSALAAAGNVMHGSGPWQASRHTVGKPLADGIALGIRDGEGTVAQAAALTAGNALKAAEQASIRAASVVLGGNVAASIARGLEGKQVSVHQQVINTMQAALAERGEINTAARVLGRHQAEMIAAGVLGYQPSLAAQISQALRDAMRQAMQAAKQTVDTSMGNLISSFDNLKSQILSAFDAINSAGSKTGKFAGSAKTRKEAAALDAEQKAADAQAVAEQRAQLADAIQKARTQRSQDAASGASQDQLNQDDQAIAQAIQAQSDFEQQQKIKADQAQLEEDQKRDKDNLEKRLAALRREIKAHPERAKQIRVEIDNLLKQYGITPQAVTNASDFDASASLFTAGMGDLKKSMDALTAATVKLADLQAGASTSNNSNGNGKMPHAATGGIFKDVPGGVIRVLEGGHPEGIVSLDPGKRSRSLSVWAQIGKQLNAPGFADGGVAGKTKINPVTGGPDDPLSRASAMFANDFGEDKFQSDIATALIGAIGPRAQIRAALRGTRVKLSSGLVELHAGLFRGAPASGFSGKLMDTWKSKYPGITWEPFQSLMNIGYPGAISRLPLGGQELGGLLMRASAGDQLARDDLSKLTSHALHAEGAAPTPMGAQYLPRKGGSGGDGGGGGAPGSTFDPGGRMPAAAFGGIFGRMPMLEHGGITTRSGVAFLHPNEAVIPLPKGSTASIGGGGTIHVEHLHVNGDLSDPTQRRQMARALLDDMHSELARKKQRVQTLGLS